MAALPQLSPIMHGSWKRIYCFLHDVIHVQYRVFLACAVLENALDAVLKEGRKRELK